MTTIRTLAVFLSFAALLVIPAPSSAAAAERSYQLRTRIVEQAPSVGEYDGSLQLRISPDGIISGYYRPDDNARFIAVTGGLTGDRFWIDIASFSRHPLRFSGTFHNGNIDAQGNAPILDDGRFTGLNLIGTPQSG